MKKVTIVLIIVVLLVTTGTGCAQIRERRTASTQPEVLREGTVIRGNLAQRVSASGNVNANRRSELYFNLSGTVETVAVEVNTHVTAGETLATLESADLERTVQQAELALQQAELELASLLEPPEESDITVARANVQSAAQALETARLSKETARADAQAQQVQAQREREAAHIRYRDALDSGKGVKAAEDAYQEAQARERIAELSAEQLQEQADSQWWSAYQRYRQAVRAQNQLQEGPDSDRVRQQELQVEQARLSLQQAQERLADTVLRAPFAGLVATVNVQEGLEAPTTRPAFTLIDDSRYYVDVMIDEIDIGRVAEGQLATITLDAYPQAPLEGVVTRIAPAPQNVGGLTAYEVRITLPPPAETEQQIREGMTASVNVATSELADALLIPRWAVVTDQESNEIYTYRLVDGVPQRTPLTTDAYNEDFIQVQAGVEEGDTVVLVAEERMLLSEDGPPGPPRR